MCVFVCVGVCRCACDGKCTALRQQRRWRQEHASQQWHLAPTVCLVKLGQIVAIEYVTLVVLGPDGRNVLERVLGMEGGGTKWSNQQFRCVVGLRNYNSPLAHCSTGRTAGTVSSVGKLLAHLG